MIRIYQMTEACEAAINLELLRGMGIMILTFGALSFAVWIGVTIKRWLVDLAHYMGGGE